MVPLSINAMYGNIEVNDPNYECTITIGLTNTTMYNETFYVHTFGYVAQNNYETTLGGSALIRLRSNV